MKRIESRWLTLGLIFTLVFGLVLSVNLVGLVSVYAQDSTPPRVTIVTPEAVTYSTSSVELVVNVNEEVSWMGYSLDGAENVTASEITTLSSLLDGAHTVLVYANDTNGNTGASGVVYFSVDTTAPVITITSPQKINYSSRQVLLDFDINEQTLWIGYSLDEQPNVTLTGNTILTGLSDGDHAVVVYATDLAGNMGASDDVPFTVFALPFGTTPPQVIVTSPRNTIYANVNIPLYFAVYGETVSWMGYSLDGAANITISGNLILTDIPEGMHTITVYSTDIYARTGASNMVAFEVKLPIPDTTPPEIILTSPQNMTYPEPNVPLYFSVYGPLSWMGYSLDGAANITISGNLILTGLSEGNHTLTFYATDLEGNTGTSGMIAFEVKFPLPDTTPPGIIITSPQNIIYEVRNVSLVFVVDEQVSWMAYSLDGAYNSTVTGNVTLSGLPNGIHNITVVATDYAWNTGKSDIVQFEVDVDIIPPEVIINSPTSNVSRVSDVLLDFSVDEDVAWVGYSLDGGDNITITDDTVMAGLSDGDHTVVVYATDLVGNTGVSDVVHFFVSFQSDDVTPPIVTITSPKNSTYNTNNVTFSFTVNEEFSFAYYTLDGKANVLGVTSVLLTNLSNGGHVITLYAQDLNGNTGASETVEFTISTDNTLQLWIIGLLAVATFIGFIIIITRRSNAHAIKRHLQ